ncbi:unnamed protein product [Protopolystoma xenopodis]|uniref:Uncharacterized protein n=1 Tax=Protopolystoma xenopodis TaxID=117903 RepID=A0A3S5AV94_9PLAT|nr:unnamed protein product [Protopolystoma xenopodis]
MYNNSIIARIFSFLYILFCYLANPCIERNQFHCRTTNAQSQDLPSKCIPFEEVCDGKRDCLNGDDEAEGPRSNCTLMKCSEDNGGCDQSDRACGTFPDVSPASSVSIAILSTTQQLVKETSEADPLTKRVLKSCDISPSAMGYSDFIYPPITPSLSQFFTVTI